MIIVKTYKDGWNPNGWYIAQSTKLGKMVSGNTKINALTNLRFVIRKEIDNKKLK